MLIEIMAIVTLVFLSGALAAAILGVVVMPSFTPPLEFPSVEECRMRSVAQAARRAWLREHAHGRGLGLEEGALLVERNTRMIVAMASSYAAVCGKRRARRQSPICTPADLTALGFDQLKVKQLWPQVQRAGEVAYRGMA